MIDLKIKHKWIVWKPKRGRYKGKTLYVAKVLEPRDSRGYYGHHIDVILSRIDGNKIYMHKGQITDYQMQNNCRYMNEDEQQLLPKLEERFEQYREYWVDMRVKKTAKSLLMDGKKR